MKASLRAAGDRDLSDLTATVRAQHHLVRALAITQLQHTELLRRVEDTLQGHGVKLDQIVTLVTELIDRDARDDGGGE